MTTNGINVARSNQDFLPKTSFVFEGSEHPFVLFLFDDSGSTKVEMTNTTGATKQSPYRSAHILLEGFIERIRPFRLQGLDHTGFNLPSFEGVHPKILELRQQLKETCLYHMFPKHVEDAPWDFILPGTQEEIQGSQKTDYRHVRKPKREIVSFENSSTSLLQIDIQVQGHYEDLVKVFPEALHVPERRNRWMYLQNDFGIDVCFVLNEASENDWSSQLRNDR